MEFIQQVLKNNRNENLIEELLKLDKYNNKILKKIRDAKKNELTALSIITEFIILKKLIDTFEGVEYEYKILGKEPDFLISSNNQKILGDIKRVQQDNQIVNDKIQAFHNGYDLVEPPILISTENFIKIKSDINDKLKKYCHIINDCKMSFVVMLDIRHYSFAISNSDIIYYMHLYFENCNYYFPKNDFNELLTSVIFFDNNSTYLNVMNSNAKYSLNEDNVVLFNNTFNAVLQYL